MIDKKLYLTSGIFESLFDDNVECWIIYRWLHIHFSNGFHLKIFKRIAQSRNFFDHTLMKMLFVYSRQTKHDSFDIELPRAKCILVKLVFALYKIIIFSYSRKIRDSGRSTQYEFTAMYFTIFLRVKIIRRAKVRPERKTRNNPTVRPYK